MTVQDPVIVARIVRAHGIRGGLLIEAETDHAEALFQPGRRLHFVEAATLPDGRAIDVLTIDSARLHGRRWLVTTREVADRTPAEALRGARLGVPRDALPDLPEGGYLLHDLVGMSVSESGQVLGVIHEVYDQPGAPLLAVEIEGRERLIPFQEELVDRVDVDAREVHVTLPAGLLDI